MKPDIEYPYMPEGRELKYVPHDYPLMKEAKRAMEECAGDPIHPVGAVLVKDGKVLARAGNGFSLGPKQIHVCPRRVLECKSGEGYDLCDVHDPPGHSEPMLMKAADEKGIDTKDCDVYMYGHWWACEPCWKTLIDHGIKNLFVTDDAHIRFSKENVYARTLVPSIKNVYIAGAMTNLGENKDEMYKFYDMLGDVCVNLGITPFIPYKHTEPEKNPDASHREIFDAGIENVYKHDVTVAEVSYPSLGTGGEIAHAYAIGRPIVLLSKKGAHVSRFATGNAAVVYHIEYETPEDAARMLKNVLRQL